MPLWQYVPLALPVGVVGSIIPWNYPTVLAIVKLGPALATGFTVVNPIKTS